jgi:hypothetical protein
MSEALKELENNLTTSLVDRRKLVASLKEINSLINKLEKAIIKGQNLKLHVLLSPAKNKYFQVADIQEKLDQFEEELTSLQSEKEELIQQISNFEETTELARGEIDQLENEEIIAAYTPNNGGFTPGSITGSLIPEDLDGFTNFTFTKFAIGALSFTDFSFTDFSFTNFDFTDFDFTPLEFTDFNFTDFDFTDFNFTDFDFTDFNFTDYDTTNFTYENFISDEITNLINSRQPGKIDLSEEVGLVKKEHVLLGQNQQKLEIEKAKIETEINKLEEIILLLKQKKQLLGHAARLRVTNYQFDKYAQETANFLEENLNLIERIELIDQEINSL